MVDVSTNVVLVVVAALVVFLILIWVVSRKQSIKKLSFNMGKGLFHFDTETHPTSQKVSSIKKNNDATLVLAESHADSSKTKNDHEALNTSMHDLPVVALTTSINGCTWFFKKNMRFSELRIFAMSGQRFMEAIYDAEIIVDSVKIIMPTDDALKAYFGSNETAFASVKLDIDAICNGSTATKLSGLIKRLDTKRIGSFPLNFYAIVSEELAMSGVYTLDKVRNAIPLKSRAWKTQDKNSIKERLLQFNALWNEN